MGYVNYSMSENAANAYRNGEKPLSKWGKRDILSAVFCAIQSGEIEVNFSMELFRKLPVSAMRETVLCATSWHHTSSYYNKTDFYSLDAYELEALTDSAISAKLDTIKEGKEAAKTRKQQDAAPDLWKCSFLEWSGTRNHPKATELTEIGEVKGNWFIRSDGSKKKTTANGFKFIERVNT